MEDVMSHTIAAFHSALGLRPAIHEFAQLLRNDGHIVHTPDLFDGEVFDNLTDGIAKRDAVGIPELSRRATVAVESLPSDCVYVGFSMGAASAQYLAASRPGAKAVILCHAALPPALMGIEEWPSVPVQVHYAEGDPWVEKDQAAAFRDAVKAVDQTWDEYVYPGSGHLFSDRDSPDYDRESYALVVQRVLSFLSSV
jgi:dienelactone hydrolase